MRIVAAMMILTSLSACATTQSLVLRVDGSTPDSFARTYGALVESLNSKQRAELDGAVLLLGATKMHQEDPTGARGGGFGPATLRTELNGKTFAEIILAARATGTTIVSVERQSR